MEDLCYKLPNILSLSGITLNDYVSLEDTADERFYVESDKDSTFTYPYNKIPQVFTGLKDWPTSTNLCCWSCGFKFNTVPIFIPIHIREVNDSIEIGVSGNMCSFNCAELWIETHTFNKEDKCKLQNNLCYLYYIFTGKRITHIRAAPCRTNLLQYGGFWTEEMFLKKMKELEPN